MEHNLKVRASKCCFGADQVRFLGLTVSSAGLHTDPKKIAAVSNLASPKNVVHQSGGIESRAVQSATFIRSSNDNANCHHTPCPSWHKLTRAELLIFGIM